VFIEITVPLAEASGNLFEVGSKLLNLIYFIYKLPPTLVGGQIREKQKALAKNKEMIFLIALA
jgi:hypothetical protein